jgi:hypothetical protein
MSSNSAPKSSNSALNRRSFLASSAAIAAVPAVAGVNAQQATTARATTGLASTATPAQAAGQPTVMPQVTTKTTTRLFGANPFEVAVAVTQHLWPAVLPPSAQSVPDRPRGLTLLVPDDPLTAITATPLVHFPDDAPILWVTKSGIPDVTRNEIRRLGPPGIARFNNVQAFLVGAAANPGVEAELTAMGIKWFAVTAPNIPELANRVDDLYGRITNPDTGVVEMGNNGAENVVIGSIDGKDYQFLLPATHWVTHMPTGLLWVSKDSVPQGTIEALRRRNVTAARIYVFGGPDQISASVIRQLSRFGSVLRVTNDDEVAFNAPPTNTPVDTAIVFNKMWDNIGWMGWKITGPGHGFTLVSLDDWQGAVASSPLSHLGFHAPLLFTTSPTQLPAIVDAYYKAVAPTFLTSPADGPYNMTYVIGSFDQITWGLQAHVDNISEMANRRGWGVNTGGRYSDSQP